MMELWLALSRANILTPVLSLWPPKVHYFEVLLIIVIFANYSHLCPLQFPYRYDNLSISMHITQVLSWFHWDLFL